MSDAVSVRKQIVRALEEEAAALDAMPLAVARRSSAAGVMHEAARIARECPVVEPSPR